MTLFHEHFARGLLKKQPPNFGQIQKQIQRAFQDIKTAEHVLSYDPEWAAAIAYQAMLRAGRALLFAHGYLPTDGAQHKTVVELTGKILGLPFANLVRQFEKMRRKRNLFFYDSEDTGNIDEAKTALDIARQLLEKIKCAIEVLNPQIRFNL